MHGTETIKGVVTAMAGFSWVSWITSNVTMSTISFVGSMIGAGAVWYLTQMQKRADKAREARNRDAEDMRHQQLLDALQRMNINDVRVAAMVAELKRRDKETPGS